MSSRRTGRQLFVAVLLGVLVGGGLMAVTPAGAEVSNAVATNWKKIWNKELKPQADQRYYTKKKSNKRYYTKSDSDAKYQAKGNYALNGSSYTKAESDSKYAGAGSAYTKAESDGRYRRSTELVRGNVMIVFTATAAGQLGGSEISLGSTFSAAPAIHVIPPGAAAPAGCSGNAASPNADPGHLCIFGSLLSNAGTPNTCKVSTASCFGTATDPWGASIFINATAAGAAQYFATWAARPIAVAPTAVGRSDVVRPEPPSSGVER
jgi:hypothetical protein